MKLNKAEKFFIVNLLTKDINNICLDWNITNSDNVNESLSEFDLIIERATLDDNDELSETCSLAKKDYLYRCNIRNKLEDKFPVRKITSEKTIDFLEECKTISPDIFLQSIKKEKNSFVTEPEISLLKTLTERSPLPDSVINILLHYVLIIQDNTTLQPNYVGQIATDWAEQSLMTPEQVINYVSKSEKK